MKAYYPSQDSANRSHVLRDALTAAEKEQSIHPCPKNREAVRNARIAFQSHTRTAWGQAKNLPEPARFIGALR